jgi:SAM-dependent methyltransferase
MINKIENKFDKLSNKFDFKGIFKPTLTSKLLINSSYNLLKKKQKVLDLGCGGGIITACLFDVNKDSHYYLSDISKKAVLKAKKNLQNYNGNFHFKSGNGLEPWEGEKFDLIINDISGISSEVAKISPWFKNVPVDRSIDGTYLLSSTLKKVRKFMNKKSIIVFPIISLCNVEKAKTFLKKKFKILKKFEFEWPLPKQMLRHINKLESLKKKNIVSYEKKYGIVICKTAIIIAKKC